MEIQEAGESAVGANAGANKDQGLTHEYITPYRGLFHREPATVVRVTLERGSAQRAGQLRDRKSVVQSSFRDAVTLIYHTGQILLGPFWGSLRPALWGSELPDRATLPFRIEEQAVALYNQNLS